MSKTRLFTIGPVEMYPQSLAIYGQQVPYFRNAAFSKIMFSIEKSFLQSVSAPSDALFVGLTSSGTGGMEAAVVNTLTSKDKALIVNGGSFGERFTQICTAFDIPFKEIRLAEGEALTLDMLNAAVSGSGCTALLVNACESSTGQLYNLSELGAFCQEQGLIFIVDAVSSYLADPIDMASMHIDLLLTASQKALALAPGVSLLAFTYELFETRIAQKNHPAYYFDLASYVENQKRGQPPFTSDISTMLALDERLQDILSQGVDKQNELHQTRASYFRSRIDSLPVHLPAFSLSNCCTPLIFETDCARELFERMEKNHGMTLTPSGGELGKRQLRVGHLGNLALDDYDRLVEALKQELNV